MAKTLHILWTRRSSHIVLANTGYFCIQTLNETQQLFGLHCSKDSTPASVLGNALAQAKNSCKEIWLLLDEIRDLTVVDTLTQYAKM